jgi:hypothetical protein
MSKVTRLPPLAKTARVDAEIPVSQRDVFEPPPTRHNPLASATGDPSRPAIAG